MKNKHIDRVSTIYGTIDQVRIDSETGRSFIKVRLDNGSLIGGIINQAALPKQVDLTKIDYRLMKFDQSSEAAIQAGHEYAAVIGSPENRFISTKDHGNFITGPTTFTSHPESIRLGGVFRINGLHTSTMASSIVTPMPLLILDIPGQNIISILNETFKDFKTILGI